MKKSLSLLVAVCMVFSMFASVAFAADAAQPSTQQKFDALKEQGIFTGYPDGSAGLDKNMTRAQFAVVLKRVNNLENAAAASKYVDVPAKHWAIGEIGAVTKASLMQGVGANKFDPNGNVTIEALATTLVRALDLEPVEGATVAGASAWAAGYVQAALDAKIIPSATNYKAAATRGQLVDATYAFVGGVVSVKSAVAVDSKTVKVTFSDDQVVTKELSEALKAGVATKVTVEYNGKSYEVTVTLSAVAAEAKAVGAKKIEVKFNQGVDASKVTFAVYNPSNVPVNVAKTTVSDDKATYTLELASVIVKGDYTVKANGLGQDVSAKFTAEDAKVAKIEFTSDKAAQNRTVASVVYAGVKITNQYGEDVTKDEIGNVVFTFTPSKKFSYASNGTLTIEGDANYNIDAKISATALHSKSTTFGSAILTVAPAARVEKVTVEKLTNTVDSSKTLAVGSTAGDFVLVVDAKDQYGNGVLDAAAFNEDVQVTSTNAYVVDKGAVKKVSIDGTDKLVITLANGNTGSLKAGTSKFILVPVRYGNNQASFDVVVKDSIKVKDLNLSTPSIAVAGEDIEIPFTAADQFGNAITKAGDLNAGVTNITVSGSIAAGKTVTAEFKQDYVKNTAKLIVHGANAVKGTLYLSIITGVNEYKTVSFNVVDPAVGSLVSATKDFTPNFIEKATGDLKIGNVVVKDQYGRDFTISDTKNTDYRVTVKTSDASKVALSGATVADDTYVLNPAANAITFSAVKKGSATITLTLEKYDTANSKYVAVSGSEYTFNARVVDKGDVASYEIGAIGTLLNAGAAGYKADHNRKVEVKGVLADGAKVVLPVSYYNVTSASSKVDVTSENKLVANGFVADDFKNGDVKVNVVVTVLAGEKPVVESKEVVVSNNGTAANTLELKAGSFKLDGGVIYAPVSAINTKANVDLLTVNVVKTIDQYGVEKATAFKSIIVSNVNNGHTLATAVAGDTITVVAVTDNGKTITFNVVVEA